MGVEDDGEFPPLQLSDAHRALPEWQQSHSLATASTCTDESGTTKEDVVGGSNLRYQRGTSWSSCQYFGGLGYPPNQREQCSGGEPY